MKNRSLKWLLLTLALAFPCACQSGSNPQLSKAHGTGTGTGTGNPNPSSQPERPNVIVFLVDDMGWQDTSVPFHSEVTDLNRIYRTPNMQRLAAEGVMFTQAYASAVCSPSRVSLMTGMNAARHGVTNWTLHFNRSPGPKRKNITPPDWPVNGIAPPLPQLACRKFCRPRDIKPFTSARRTSVPSVPPVKIHSI